MSHHTDYDPYIPLNPGDVITAEDWNELQQYIKADLADNLSAIGDYRRYFKQMDRELSGGQIEPAVIEHRLNRHPMIEIYELAPLFEEEPLAGEQKPFDWQNVKFLVYYASRRDPIAELLRTETHDWFHWGDPLALWLGQFEVEPSASQAFDDLLNDLWGHMFDPGLEQDQFKREAYGHTGYVQRWIDADKTVGELMETGRWDDLYIAVRPQLFTSSIAKSPTPAPIEPSGQIQVYHLSQNATEIQVPRAMDLMILMRS